MKRARMWSVGAALALVPGGAIAQSATTDTSGACTVRVEGDIPRTITIGAEQLHALPQHEVRATAGHTPDTATYLGVRLVEVLALANVRLGPGPKGTGVAQYVVARAADDYRAVYAIAELDSAMTSREVWLVDRKNGQPLDAFEGPCRILVPSDRRHARSVRQVKTLEFRQVP